jgi:hypothetical protein
MGLIEDQRQEKQLIAQIGQFAGNGIDGADRDQAGAVPRRGVSLGHCVDFLVWYDPCGSIYTTIRRDQAIMTGNQLRAARALIGWSQAQVAEAARLSIPTVKRAEGQAAISASAEAVAALRVALEAAGVEFIAVNGGGAGVRLRR